MFEQKKEEEVDYDKTGIWHCCRFVAEPGFILYNGKILEKITHYCVYIDVEVSMEAM